MKNNSVLALLQDSSAMLEIAAHELERPDEDIVTIGACQCTRNSVIGFLRSYLLEKKSLLKFHNSLEKLLSECAMVDPSFNNIDISCFVCKTEDGDCSGAYCLAQHKVLECYKRAQMIKEFVLAKLNLNPGFLD
jgi:hypothetical protein